MALDPIYLKKRVVKNGNFIKNHITAVPGEWAIRDNPTTPSKLELDFLDERMGWERASDDDIAAYRKALAESQSRAREKDVESKVQDVLAQENAVAAVMTRVEQRKAANKPSEAKPESTRAAAKT